MKSMQFFISEKLANEIISFVDEHLDVDVPYNLKIFTLILKDNFQKGQQDDV